MGKLTAEFLKQSAGQVVDREFPLREYLGGGANSAVYLTEHGGKKAAIKLIPADPKTAETQLSRWQAASKLSHPHLIQLFKTGRCKLENTAAIYVVMEYMEENLSQVLPERPLTPVEIREMLEPLLSALAYLHSQGWVHGHLRPSNIMAIDDRLKLSSDWVCRAGESKGGAPADDVWALGLTLVEVLTQRREALIPATLPEPFRDIARHCLEPDPAKRWTVADVSAHLQGRSSKWRYLIPAAAVLAVPLIWFAVKSTGDSTGIAPPPASQPEVKKVSPEVTPVPPPETKPEAPPPEKVQPQTQARVKTQRDLPPKPHAEPPIPVGASTISSSEGVAIQVLPDIPAKARSTIQRRAKVTVRVRVDPTGNVLEAKLDPPPSSRYFGERTLKAARLWKFKPSDSDQEWVLNFEILRSETKVSPVRVGR